MVVQYINLYKVNILSLRSWWALTINIASLVIFFLAGSGFKSLNPYSSGYFGAAIKLQTGYTAGVITSFYV